MKKIIVATALVLGLTQIAACESTITRQESGGVMGAVVGGVVGSQVGGGRGKDLATLAGVIAGAMAGSNLGKSLDRLDEMNAQRALEVSQTNYTTNWRNPDQNHDVAFTPTRTYQSNSGGYCREYQTQITVNGRHETGYGNACRQPDGSWKMVGS